MDDRKAMIEQMPEQVPSNDILGACAICRRKVLIGSGRLVDTPRLYTVHYHRCEAKFRAILAEAEALIAERLTK